MYDPIFAKSFSRNERKRFACCAFILCLITAWGIFSTNFRPYLQHPLSVIGDAVKLHLSINAVEDVLAAADDTTQISEPTVGNSSEDLHAPVNAVVNDTSTAISQSRAIERKEVEPICRKSNYCEIEGDIRVEANSSTIFFITPLEGISRSTFIQPYLRGGISTVKNWTVKMLSNEDADHDDVPKCTQNHNHPAILFSVGGFSGNIFHDFADTLFPLYSTSFHFQKEVHFLVSDYKLWWINKFRYILDKLTKHKILDVDNEKGQVHCYKKMIAGLKFHKEFIMDPSLTNSSAGLSMQAFRQLLGQTYSLERKRAVRLTKGDGTRPRLMIIARNRSRILSNADEVSRLARKLGYEVVLTEAGVSTMSRFAQTVNSCDVLMGVHGAGLTNMLFLPDNAVLIQVVPFGALDRIARLDFGNPAAGMNIRYLQYQVTVRESSLVQQYPIDHPVLKDPKSVKGWKSVWSIYMKNQNVTIDLHRFEGTLAKALRLLRH